MDNFLKVTKLGEQFDPERNLWRNVLIVALADQVYTNKINNIQVWDIYDEFLTGFRKSKNKVNYLTNAIYRTQ